MTDAELSARMDRLEAKLADFGTKIAALEIGYATGAVHQANVEKRLSSIEDMLRWLTRIVVGGLIMAAIAFAMKGGFVIA